MLDYSQAEVFTSVPGISLHGRDSDAGVYSDGPRRVVLATDERAEAV